MRRGDNDLAMHSSSANTKMRMSWRGGVQEETGQIGRMQRVLCGRKSGICRFWDDSCRATGCGAAMWKKVLTRAFGWYTVNNKVEPVFEANGFSMRTPQAVKHELHASADELTNVLDDLVLQCTLHFSVMASHTSVRRNHALEPGVVPVVHVAWVCDTRSC